MIKNFMEEYADTQLKRILKTQPEYAKLCEDTDFYQGVLALALNDIKPLYYTSKEGEVYLAYQQIALQNRNDVISALTKSLEIMKQEFESLQ